MNRTSLVAAILGLVLLPGCSGDSPTAPPTVDRVSVSPAQAEINEGDTIQLRAAVRGTDGSSLSDRAVAWTTSDPAIAAVSNTGNVTGTGHGTAIITAAVEGKTASSSVTVRGRVASIAISPENPSVAEGATLQLSAVLKATNGVVLTDRPVAWTTDSPAIADVSATGLVTGVLDGLAGVTAASEGVAGRVTLDVRGEVASVTLSPAQASLNEPESASLTAAVRSRKGTLLTRRPITWNTSDPAIASVVSTGTLSARVTGTGHGEVTVQGSLDGVAGATALTVRGVVASIEVTPSALHMVAGQSRPLTAKAFSRNGVLLVDRPITWSTSDPAVAVVRTGQVAEAVRSGTASIRVTAEGALGTAAVTVHRILLGGAFYAHTCAIVEGLASYCWGDNTHGQLGDGSTASSAVPVKVATSAVFVALAGMGSGTYGFTAAGSAYAWGLTAFGSSAAAPAPNPAITSMAFSQLASGYNFSCGLAPDHRAYCWGNNEHGQLGDGSTTWRPTIGPPVGAGLSLAALAVSGSMTSMCGLADDGKAYCWGFNYFGQLGDGTTIDRATPVAVATPLRFVELAAGGYHTCGRTATHEVYCWGILPGTQILSTTPTLISAQPPLGHISAGLWNACLLTTTGEARCWGYNGNGSIGDGTAIDRSTPTAVAGGLRFAALRMSSTHVCGVALDDRMYCWGSNQTGEVGDGTHINRFLPRSVVWPTWP
ncbi:MAG TPA: Ig-like domain-containing protein [Arthrobacter sp.]